MSQLTKWQKKIVRARATGNSENKKSVVFVIIALPGLFILGMIAMFVFDKPVIGLGVGVVWVFLMIYVFFHTPSNSGVIVHALFMHHRHQWLEFVEELHRSDRKELKKRLAQLHLSPEDSLFRIARDFLTAHRRSQELKANLDEVKDSKRRFYTNALRLSLEWKRMETAYLLYHRSEDIHSQILQDKVLGYAERITGETSLFQQLIERFKGSLNRLAAYELDATLDLRGKHRQAAGGYQHLNNLIDELEEWSGSLTKAAEEMTTEGF